MFKWICSIVLTLFYKSNQGGFAVFALLYRFCPDRSCQGPEFKDCDICIMVLWITLCQYVITDHLIVIYRIFFSASGVSTCSYKIFYYLLNLIFDEFQLSQSFESLQVHPCTSFVQPDQLNPVLIFEDAIKKRIQCFTIVIKLIITLN